MATYSKQRTSELAGYLLSRSYSDHGFCNASAVKDNAYLKLNM